jgi:hypothetical protein
MFRLPEGGFCLLSILGLVQVMQQCPVSHILRARGRPVTLKHHITQQGVNSNVESECWSGLRATVSAVRGRRMSKTANAISQRLHKT